MWRELCWRYIVYPGSYDGRLADLVFAVFLQQRRPVIHAALVAADTGLPLPWPVTPTGESRAAAAHAGAGLGRTIFRSLGNSRLGSRKPKTT